MGQLIRTTKRTTRRTSQRIILLFRICSSSSGFTGFNISAYLGPSRPPHPRRSHSRHLRHPLAPCAPLRFPSVRPLSLPHFWTNSGLGCVHSKNLTTKTTMHFSLKERHMQCVMYEVDIHIEINIKFYVGYHKYEYVYKFRIYFAIFRAFHRI